MRKRVCVTDHCTGPAVSVSLPCARHSPPDSLTAIAFSPPPEIRAVGYEWKEGTKRGEAQRSTHSAAVETHLCVDTYTPNTHTHIHTNPGSQSQK